jgi:hypothetical protein
MPRPLPGWAIAGWTSILLVIAGWEALALVTPGRRLHLTISALAERYPVVRALAFVAWCIFGWLVIRSRR